MNSNPSGVIRTSTGSAARFVAGLTGSVDKNNASPTNIAHLNPIAVIGVRPFLEFSLRARNTISFS
jgi:hypothetical protein